MFLNWVTYLNSIGHGPQEAVWINIDETPIKFHYPKVVGLRKICSSVADRARIRDKTPTAITHGQCTLVAAISSRPDIQKILPQVILPKTKGKKISSCKHEGMPDATKM